jgi:excisionase family DNA binding protein
VGEGKTKMKARGEDARRSTVADDKRLLTPLQVADRFGVDVRTIRRWQAMGRLKARKLGRLVRFAPAEVDRLAERGF